MSEENQEPVTEQEAPAMELPKEIQEQLDELARLKAHHSKLLDETKSAKQKAQELEEARQRAEEEQQREKGQFKELWEKTQAELEAERKNANEFKTQIQRKELESEAYKMVSQLTKDTKRAELLKKEVLQFAKHGDNGVTFEVGGIVMDKDKLAVKLREDYPFLVDGTGATGGGATGANKGGALEQTNSAADTAKKKGDLAGFLNAQFAQ